MPDDDEKLVKAIGRWFVVLIASTAAAALLMNGRSDIAMYVGMGIVWFMLISGD